MYFKTFWQVLRSDLRNWFYKYYIFKLKERGCYSIDTKYYGNHNTRTNTSIDRTTCLNSLNKIFTSPRAIEAAKTCLYSLFMCLSNYYMVAAKWKQRTVNFYKHKLQYKWHFSCATPWKRNRLKSRFFKTLCLSAAAMTVRHLVRLQNRAKVWVTIASSCIYMNSVKYNYGAH